MKNVIVIGSGTMGNGIAHVFSLANYHVKLVDINPEILARAKITIEKNLDRQVSKSLINASQKESALAHIELSTDLEGISREADLAIEAVSENLSIKQDIFQKLDMHTPASCILASNTSSISITKISSFTKRPGKVIGMHFMNPVPVMKLVEVIRGYNTADETANKIQSISEEIGKIPIMVNDYPGFISNRVLMPMINEAIIALFEGVGGVYEIDTIMKLGMAHPMGPLQLADFIGLDVCLSILQVLYEGLGNTRYAPCPLLVKMVEAGHLGGKSGAGFYDWSEGTKSPTVSKQFS